MVIDEYYNKAIEALKDEQKAFHNLMEAGRTFDVQRYSDCLDSVNLAINRRTTALKNLVTVRNKNVTQVENEMRKHYGLEPKKED